MDTYQYITQNGKNFFATSAKPDKILFNPVFKIKYNRRTQSTVTMPDKVKNQYYNEVYKKKYK